MMALGETRITVRIAIEEIRVTMTAAKVATMATMVGIVEQLQRICMSCSMRLASMASLLAGART